ncbi:hypothetical protein B0T26DRAFT_749293 [Lasiosphaeria miniovina]|uniref:protein S-acyltransferase n=1 Tax=Lasiosphaeria miniovina TaxID=1954250 RepID=A0AA40ATU6_9PEZI|nr:uncharacterized protein B0T26DRAFT_749293 [Lasiosphaeria miniovina]KAK0721814.1 hypothetical protein B0T26DRAFT_749293 [Lasiosphaeria miniovina]
MQQSELSTLERIRALVRAKAAEMPDDQAGQGAEATEPGILELIYLESFTTLHYGPLLEGRAAPFNFGMGYPALRVAGMIAQGGSFSVRRVVDHREYGVTGFVVVKQPVVNEWRVGAGFAEKLRDVMTELRVLTHRPLRNHPYIVNLREIFWDTHADLADTVAPSLILEYANLGSLSDHQDPDRLCLHAGAKNKICENVALGLSFLHMSGIIHGDVKSQQASDVDLPKAEAILRSTVRLDPELRAKNLVTILEICQQPNDPGGYLQIDALMRLFDRLRSKIDTVGIGGLVDLELQNGAEKMAKISALEPAPLNYGDFSISLPKFPVYMHRLRSLHPSFRALVGEMLLERVRNSPPAQEKAWAYLALGVFRIQGAHYNLDGPGEEGMPDTLPLPKAEDAIFKSAELGNPLAQSLVPKMIALLDEKHKIDTETVVDMLVNSMREGSRIARIELQRLSVEAFEGAVASIEEGRRALSEELDTDAEQLPHAPPLYSALFERPNFSALDPAAQRVLHRPGVTALHQAVYLGSLSTCKYLVERYHYAGCIDVRSNELETPLHFAARNAQCDVARYLLERGADPKAQTKDGLTVLHMALLSYKQETNMLELLLAHGADVRAVADHKTDDFLPDCYDYYLDFAGSALHFATTIQNLPAVEVLLEAGGDANQIDYGRNQVTSPLMIAIKHHSLPLLKLLLRYAVTGDNRPEPRIYLELCNRDSDPLIKKLWWTEEPPDKFPSRAAALMQHAGIEVKLRELLNLTLRKDLNGAEKLLHILRKSVLGPKTPVKLFEVPLEKPAGDAGMSEDLITALWIAALRSDDAQLLDHYTRKLGVEDRSLTKMSKRALGKLAEDVEMSEDLIKVLYESLKVNSREVIETILKYMPRPLPSRHSNGTPLLNSLAFRQPEPRSHTAAIVKMLVESGVDIHATGDDAAIDVLLDPDVVGADNQFSTEDVGHAIEGCIIKGGPLSYKMLRILFARRPDTLCTPLPTRTNCACSDTPSEVATGAHKSIACRWDSNYLRGLAASTRFQKDEEVASLLAELIQRTRAIDAGRGEEALRARLDEQIPNWKGTPLHYAAQWGSVEVAKILLRAGANVNAQVEMRRPDRSTWANEGISLGEVVVMSRVKVLLETEIAQAEASQDDDAQAEDSQNEGFQDDDPGDEDSEDDSVQGEDLKAKSFNPITLLKLIILRRRKTKRKAERVKAKIERIRAIIEGIQHLQAKVERQMEKFQREIAAIKRKRRIDALESSSRELAQKALPTLYGETPLDFSTTRDWDRSLEGWPEQDKAFVRRQRMQGGTHREEREYNQQTSTMVDLLRENGAMNCEELYMDKVMALASAFPDYADK